MFGFTPGLFAQSHNARNQRIAPPPIARTPILNGRPPDLGDEAATGIVRLFHHFANDDPIEAFLLARLRQLTLRLEKSALAEPAGLGDPAWHRYESQADRSFRAMLALWLRYNMMKTRAERKAAPSRRAAASAPAETSPAPAEAQPAPIPTIPAAEPPCPENWREHLIIDPAVSTTWPVVKGTKLWADHVASMIEDGWPLSEMLKRYPSLTPENVAACRHADAMRLCGPWPNGVPPEPRPRSSDVRPDDPWERRTRV